MPPTFILVRHAQGTHNLAAETEGYSAYTNSAYRDAQLTPKGIGQAQNTGAAIAETWPSVAAVWCSPLTRCLQTATYILEKVQVPSDAKFVHEYLIERQRAGDICNQRAELSEVQALWPDFQVNLSTDSAKVGENEVAVKTRAFLLLEHLRRKYADATEPVLIVTHFEVLYEIVGRAFENAEFVIL